VIPQCVSNFGFAERTSIEARPVFTPAHGPRIIRFHDGVRTKREQRLLAKRISLAWKPPTG
jgi:hypothetical protein